MEDLNVYTKIKQLKAEWMMRCATIQAQIKPDLSSGAIIINSLIINSICEGELVAIKGCVAELEASFGTLIDNVEKQLKE